MWLLPPLLLLIVPGSSVDITGPEEVRGLERGVVTVPCRYDPYWETYPKWWCRGAFWNSCKILVQTNGSAFGVVGRMSIRDDLTNHMITVTMKELRQEDTDTYWCGIERSGTDSGVPVKVTIDQATTTGPTPTSTLTFTANTTDAPKDTTGSPTVTNHDSDGRFQLSITHFLLLLFLKVPLLLSMLGAILWVNRTQRASGKRQSQPRSEKQ